MRSKLLSSAAALALLTGAVLAGVGPASAQNWNHGGWHGGWHGGGWGWPAAAAAGIVGGTIAAATSPLWAPGYYDSYDSYSPGYAYGPYRGGDSYSPNGYDNGYAYRGGGYNEGGYAYGPPPAAGAAPGTAVAQGDTMAYCQSRYRSYDPASGTFMGFDGQRHPCP